MLVVGAINRQILTVQFVTGNWQPKSCVHMQFAFGRRRHIRRIHTCTIDLLTVSQRQTSLGDEYQDSHLCIWSGEKHACMNVCDFCSLLLSSLAYIRPAGMRHACMHACIMHACPMICSMCRPPLLVRQLTVRNVKRIQGTWMCV
jgi:hypothetical protein